MNVVYRLIFKDREIKGIKPYQYIGVKSNCIIKNGLIFENSGKNYWGSSYSSVMQNLLNGGIFPIVEILGEFETYDTAHAFEIELLVENDAARNPTFFNMSNGVLNMFHKPGYGTYKHKDNPECIKRLSMDDPLVKEGVYVGVSKNIPNKKSKTIYVNIKTGERLALSKDERLSKEDSSDWKNHFYGKTHSAESSKLMSESQKKNMTPERIQILSAQAKKRFTGRPTSEKQKKAVSESSRGRMLIKNPMTGECKHILITEISNYAGWKTPFKLMLLTAERKECDKCHLHFYEWKHKVCKFQILGEFYEYIKSIVQNKDISAIAQTATILKFIDYKDDKNLLIEYIRKVRNESN